MHSNLPGPQKFVVFCVRPSRSENRSENNTTSGQVLGNALIGKVDFQVTGNPTTQASGIISELVPVIRPCRAPFLMTRGNRTQLVRNRLRQWVFSV
jgi:hypothetical protein